MSLINDNRITIEKAKEQTNRPVIFIEIGIMKYENSAECSYKAFFNGFFNSYSIIAFGKTPKEAIEILLEKGEECYFNKSAEFKLHDFTERHEYEIPIKDKITDLIGDISKELNDLDNAHKRNIRKNLDEILKLIKFEDRDLGK